MIGLTTVANAQSWPTKQKKSKKLKNRQQEPEKWQYLSPEKIEADYKNVRGGWKYLKWGMSIDEVKCLYKHYNQQDRHSFIMKNDGGQVAISLGEDRSIVSDEIAYMINDGTNYFFRDRLIAVAISLRDSTDEDFAVAVRTLRKRFPKGKMVRMYGTPGHFRYQSADLVVFTLSRTREYAVIYYNPRAIREIQYLQEQQAQAEKKTRARGIEQKF
jgi:hypothetical protein